MSVESQTIPQSESPMFSSHLQTRAQTLIRFKAFIFNLFRTLLRVCAVDFSS